MAEAFLVGPAEHTDTRPAGRALLASDPRPELDRVACPCLCLWGASDNWVPLEDGMEYARRLRAPLRTIAGCGHLLIGERPDACLAAIREFAAGAPLVSRPAARTGSPPRRPRPRGAAAEELDRRATTSTALRRLPSSSHERDLSRPSTATRRPLPRYSAQSSAWRSQAAHAHEVGAAVAARPVDREHEARHLLAVPTSRSSTSVARFPISVTTFTSRLLVACLRR